jgi:ABC-type microcin C transport system permease subunit YejE
LEKVGHLLRTEGTHEVREGMKNQVWWYMPVISATWEVEVEGSLLEVALDKIMKNKLKQKGFGVWLKWKSPSSNI